MRQDQAMADEKLIQAWRRWAGEHGMERDQLDDAEATIELLLHLRRVVIDNRVRHWVATHLYELLFGLFPPNFRLDDPEAERIATHVGSFLRFLDATGQLDGDSDELSLLLVAVEDIAEQLTEADDDGMPARHQISLPADAVLPLVRLAPDDDLTEAALAVPAYRRLRAFVDWVGEGRKLTRAGNLTVADGVALAEVLGTDDLSPDRPDRLDRPDRRVRVRSSRDLPTVEATFSWALVAGLVADAGGRVRRTADA